MLRVVFLVLCTIALVHARKITCHKTPAADVTAADVWFKQTTDHFDPLNNNTFQQRYWANLSAWEQNHPIMFVFAGEAPLEDFYGVTSGIIADIAMEHNAGILYLEHRFYGKSMPTADTSTENLRYLTVDQALADGAEFLATWLSEHDSWNSKVVVFGCSYSGNMAAWFKIRYPQLAVAAVAGSGPVLAVENFVQYDETVATVLGSKCADTVRQAFTTMDSMLSTPTGKQQVAKMFNICEKEFTAVDVISELSGVVQGTVQGNNADAGYPARAMCSQLQDTEGDALTKFAKYIASQQSGECVQTDFMTELANTTLSASYQGSRSWWFQTCTQFGYFQTDDTAKLFSPLLSLGWYLDVCKRAFGDSLEPNTFYINTAFGAKKPQGEHILFTNGLHDPWANLGIVSDVSATELAVTYDGAHCAPFHPPTQHDPASLVQARQTIHKFVASSLA